MKITNLVVCFLGGLIGMAIGSALFRLNQSPVRILIFAALYAVVTAALRAIAGKAGWLRE